MKTIAANLYGARDGNRTRTTAIHESADFKCATHCRGTPQTRMDIGLLFAHTVREMPVLHRFGQKIPSSLAAKFGAVLLLAALTACGGGGGGSASPVSAPAVPQIAACIAVQSVRIQLFGDSTGDGALSELQANMDVKFGAGAVQITSRARPGTTGWQLLSGTDGLNQPWPYSVNADIVVMNHGINDQQHSETKDAYAYILGKLSVAPAIVMFETMLPVKGVADDFAETMRQVAKQKGIDLIDASAYARSVTDWYDKYIIDNVHPNPGGYAAIVDTVMFQAVMPVVAKLKCQ